MKEVEGGCVTKVRGSRARTKKVDARLAGSESDLGDDGDIGEDTDARSSSDLKYHHRRQPRKFKVCGNL
jgi:hypothetical protein